VRAAWLRGGFTSKKFKGGKMTVEAASAMVTKPGQSTLGQKFRMRRSAHIRRMIDTIHAEKGSCRIIDLGGTEHYWRLFETSYLASKNVSVTLVNPLPDASVSHMFTHLQADACDVAQAPDNSYDLVHSNSTVEHVGDWSRMKAFAGEIRRLAPRYYIQTPYFWFPYEPHFRLPFFHWLPRSTRVHLQHRFTLGHRQRRNSIDEAVLSIEEVRLLDLAQFRFLFPDARIIKERVFAFTKSLIATKG
jgi:hypothetical protein